MNMNSFATLALLTAVSFNCALQSDLQNSSWLSLLVREAVLNRTMPDVGAFPVLIAILWELKFGNMLVSDFGAISRGFEMAGLPRRIPKAQGEIGAEVSDLGGRVDRDVGAWLCGSGQGRFCTGGGSAA